MDIKSFFGFEAAIEKLAIKLYLQNIKKVSLGFPQSPFSWVLNPPYFNHAAVIRKRSIT